MTERERVQIAIIGEQVKEIHEKLIGKEGLCPRVSRLEKWIWMASGGSIVVFYIIEKFLGKV